MGKKFPRFNVNQLYEKIKSETDPFVESFGQVKEDLEATIKTDDKEVNVVSTEGGTQTTVIEKPAEEIKVEEPKTEEKPAEEEKKEEPSVEEKKKEIIEKPKEVGEKEGSKLTSEGKVPKEPDKGDTPENIKALKEEATPVAADNLSSPETPPVEIKSEEKIMLEIPEITPELIDKVIADNPQLTDIDKEKLTTGIMTEMEHFISTGNNINIIANIAADHIKEFPEKDYYAALKIMEEQLKQPVEKPAEEVPTEKPVEETPSVTTETPTESKKTEEKQQIKEDVDAIIDAKPILTDALKAVGYDIMEYAISDKGDGEITITVKTKSKEEAAKTEELTIEQPPVEKPAEVTPSVETPTPTPEETPVPEAKEKKEEKPKEIGEKGDKLTSEGKIPKEPDKGDTPENIKALNEQEKPGEEVKATVLVTVSDEGVADSIVKDNADKKAFKQQTKEGKWAVMVPIEEKKEMSKEEIEERITLVKYLQKKKELSEKEKKFIEDNLNLLDK